MTKLNNAQTKTCSDNTLANLLRQRDLGVKLMWEDPGPKNTMVAYNSLYAIYGDACVRLVMVQTLKGGGYNYFLEGQINEHEKIADEIKALVS